MAAGKSDDELARTATQLPSASGSGVLSEPVGATLGRYRLERELGSGGMGVVHAAFDPDLERRIALKVLRTAGAGDDADKRLLREARAMARLVHPNVVTVHEVGSAGGRDYVAMELVEGETLAEWLRAAPRAERDVVDAFVSAGRGLAAAHAAGIVHRDFKPHNVLRSMGGRIVVTDFGLAREAQAPTDPLAETMALLPLRATAEHTPAPLSGLTQTGSMLGTPAYMAPEQWRGGAVTPATDQFAFCVALWEALAGERPFAGATVDALRDEILRGPAQLDASRLPRRLRKVVRRGLSADPAARWPSMDALLAAIRRAERRPAIAIGVTVAAVVAAGVVYGATAIGQRSTVGAGAAAAVACDAPVLDPREVWSDAMVERWRRGGRTYEAAALSRDAAAWTAARERACAAPVIMRGPRLACLDGVLTRLDIVARAVEKLPADATAAEPAGLLIDPAVCEAKAVPRLTAGGSPQLREAIAVRLLEGSVERDFDPRTATALVARVASDPCAAAISRVLAADAFEAANERAQHLGEAEQAADRCGDDRVRAEVALAVARQAIRGMFLGADISAKLRRAEAAVDRVMQRDAQAEIDRLRMELAARADHIDEAVARGESALAGFAARGRMVSEITFGLRWLDIRDERNQPADREAIERLSGAWRKRAVEVLGAAHPVVLAIDLHIAGRKFETDPRAAQLALDALARPVPQQRERRITGRVVDPQGRPVAGARVTAGPMLIGSSYGASIALPHLARTLRRTTTKADGSFEIPDGPERGVIVAELGALRARPAAVADRVDLALAPTSRIEGKVALSGRPARQMAVYAHDESLPMAMPYELVAPVAPDGSYLLDGVPRSKLRMVVAMRSGQRIAMQARTLDVRAPVMRGVDLAMTQDQRELAVIVRSTVNVPLANAQVIAFRGKRASASLLALNREFTTGSFRMARQLEGEHAPPAVVAASRSGDMFATLDSAPTGVATACAFALPADLSDPEMQRKLESMLARVEVRCVPIPPDATLVTVEVPPFPRLD